MTDAALALYSFTTGVEGALAPATDAPGGLATRMASLPLPTDEPKVRQGFIAYPNARSAGYALAHVHVARIGLDGRVRVDGDPDPTAQLRQRCPVLSCLQFRTDYPGHLCLQPDGTEIWRDWPQATTDDDVPQRSTQC